MTWDEMRTALNQAKATIYTARRYVVEMADIVAGNLKEGEVRAETLTKLKRELRDWNIHTGMWRDR